LTGVSLGSLLEKATMDMDIVDSNAASSTVSKKDKKKSKRKAEAAAAAATEGTLLEVLP
jgi:hypothetical protein